MKRADVERFKLSNSLTATVLYCLLGVVYLIMGFEINETIKTELHYKDIALISVAMGEYQRLYKETADKEVLQRMANLVNRLGVEMYNHPDNDKPNGH